MTRKDLESLAEKLAFEYYERYGNTGNPAQPFYNGYMAGFGLSRDRLEEAEAIIKLAVGSVTPYEGTNGLATLEAAVKYYNRYLK